MSAHKITDKTRIDLLKTVRRDAEAVMNSPVSVFVTAGVEFQESAAAVFEAFKSDFAPNSFNDEGGPVESVVDAPWADALEDFMWAAYNVIQSDIEETNVSAFVYYADELLNKEYDLLTWCEGFDILIADFR